MRTIKSLVIITVIMASISCFAENTLDNYQKVFNDNIAKIENSYVDAISVINKQYDTYLGQKMEVYKNKGDLDNYNGSFLYLILR